MYTDVATVLLIAARITFSPKPIAIEYSLSQDGSAVRFISIAYCKVLVGMLYMGSMCEVVNPLALRANRRMTTTHASFTSQCGERLCLCRYTTHFKVKNI